MIIMILIVIQGRARLGGVPRGCKQYIKPCCVARRYASHVGALKVDDTDDLQIHKPEVVKPEQITDAALCMQKTRRAITRKLRCVFVCVCVCVLETFDLSDPSLTPR